MSLIVDGELLVRAKPEHLAVLAGFDATSAKAISKFELEFDLKGRVELEFEMFAVNKEGITMTTAGPRTTHKPLKRDFTVKAQVEALNLHDLRSAQLIFLSGRSFDQITEFADLSAWSDEDSSGPFTCDPKLLESYYLAHLPMHIPWIVDKGVSDGMARLGEEAWEGAEQLQATGAGLLMLGQSATANLREAAEGGCYEGDFLGSLFKGIFCCSSGAAAPVPDDAPVKALADVAASGAKAG